ncbi:hypothetical protein [Arthrobacter mobilis]|uniref:Uncharacterized protein n=1 Tax=Arthrobacter mobilis TaxID=2724944 RepID=A0A7X6HED1_9MICC|nr:hypothetical protein [Arthrobacter mobilis]NKX54122.1 hypothetical protein [Arthrobacter mobilis]
MNGAGGAAAMQDDYTASAESNSKDPHDWGRAMAAAMSALAAQSSTEGSSHTDLFGRDMRLMVTETAEGVRITLSWTPAGLSPA